MAEQTLYSLIVWEMMRVLRGSPQLLAVSQIVEAVGGRIIPTAYESERVKADGLVT